MSAHAQGAAPAVAHDLNRGAGQAMRTWISGMVGLAQRFAVAFHAMMGAHRWGRRRLRRARRNRIARNAQRRMMKLAARRAGESSESFRRRLVSYPWATRLTIDGGAYDGPPITDEQYAEICARHEAAGLAVPPRDAAFGAQHGGFVVAWSTPTAESHSARTEGRADRGDEK